MKINHAAKIYIAGLILSVLLTLTSFKIVGDGEVSGNALIFVLMVFAIIQLFVQLIFFLHFGKEGKPHWNTAAFGFMAIVLVILVAGSLWIMYNLNYHMGHPADYEKHIIEDEGIHR